MLKKVFLLAVIVLLGACKSDPEIPDNILSEPEMVQVLIDIRIAEGQVNGLSLNVDSANGLFHHLEKRIFEKYEIDSADYLDSYEYYMLNPQKFLRITDIVIDSLKVRQQRLNAPKEEDSPIEKE